MDLGFKDSRQVFDPIKQTQMSISQDYWNIIDTPHFQRLSNTSCSGSANFVFASANHSYFNKSLGLLFNAEVFSNNLKLDSIDSKCLETASLCYYLGAMPFNTAFENFMREDKGIIDFNHENTSCIILEDLLNYQESNGIKFINDSEKETIYEIIKGKSKIDNDKTYLYNILNNKDYGVDIIKINDIERDCRYFGVEGGYDYDLPISTAKIINKKLAYNEKATSQLYELYKCYYKLQRNIYSHRVIVGIDLMIQDIFKLTDKKIDYVDLTNSPSKFLSFNDSFVSMIIDPCFSKSKFSSKEAKEVLNKIYSRDFYKFVGEIILDKNIINPEKITKYNILNCDSRDILKEEDLIIKKLKFSYGNGDKDPMEKATFYKNKSNIIRPFEETNYLLDRPHKFEEEIVRIYVKDKLKLIYALEAFRKFCKKDYLNLNHAYDKAFSAKKLNLCDYSFQKEVEKEESKPMDFSDYLKLKEEKNK